MTKGRESRLTLAIGLKRRKLQCLVICKGELVHVKAIVGFRFMPTTQRTPNGKSNSAVTAKEWRESKQWASPWVSAVDVREESEFW
ncbi:hypothetical protein Tco_0600684 [Tanacetum coccineum]